MDYSLAQALALTLGCLMTVIVLYDIMCQYFVNFWRRVKQNHHLQVFPPTTEIRPGIGLFHVHGHQETCFARYSPGFIPCACRVDGEIVETLWAPLVKIAGSTRAMSKSHRQEVIDDHMGDSNWKKLVNSGKRLSVTTCLF